MFWMVLAVVFAAAAGFACYYAGLFGSVYNRPGGNPQETVTRFFDSVANGDYPSAYSCLSDYSSLGLENAPASEEAALLCDALRQSYRYGLAADCEIDGLNASQAVRFHALNIRRTEEAASAAVNGILEEKLAELDPESVYDPDGGYLSSFTDLLYKTALERVLLDPEPLCTETVLDVRLQYLDGQWLIRTDRELQKALVGGEG